MDFISTPPPKSPVYLSSYQVSSLTPVQKRSLVQTLRSSLDDPLPAPQLEPKSTDNDNYVCAACQNAELLSTRASERQSARQAAVVAAQAAEAAARVEIAAEAELAATKRREAILSAKADAERRQRQAAEAEKQRAAQAAAEAAAAAAADTSARDLRARREMERRTAMRVALEQQMAAQSQRKQRVRDMSPGLVIGEERARSKFDGSGNRTLMENRMLDREIDQLLDRVRERERIIAERKTRK